MKIEINTNASAQRIEQAFNQCVAKIKANASQGNPQTELYVPKDIAPDVREKLEKEVEDLSFQPVRTGINQYTGKTEYYTSETIGDERKYKVYLRN